MALQPTVSRLTGSDYAINDNHAAKDSSESSLLISSPGSLNKQSLKRKVLFPVRYLTAILLFFGFSNVYGMRVNLSVAIVEMVAKWNGTGENGTSIVHQHFDWGSEKQGIILSSFFWGYIVTQVPGGLLAKKFGGVKVYGFGVLLTSLFTLLTPVVTNHGGYQWLLIIRIMEGLCEGVVFPAVHTIWSKWAPKLERTVLISISYAGSHAGTVLAMPLCGLLAKYYGWESIFYVYGGLGILWTIFWYFLTSETPNNHPFISVEEVEYISSTRDAMKNDLNISKIPWKSIFTSPPFWAIIVGDFCAAWGFYTLFTELPTYMKDVLKFDLSKSGFLSALPYVVLTFTVFITGPLSDVLRKWNYLSTVTVRKLLSTFSFVFQTIFLILAGFSQSSTHAVVYLVLAIGLAGFSICSIDVNILDISPNYAGVLMGISNMISVVPGIITPILTGLITPDRTTSEWRVVFYISSAVYIFGALIFGIFSSGEVQKWNEVVISQGTYEAF